MHHPIGTSYTNSIRYRVHYLPTRFSEVHYLPTRFSEVHFFSTRYLFTYQVLRSTLFPYQVFISLPGSPKYTFSLPGIYLPIRFSEVHFFPTRYFFATRYILPGTVHTSVLFIVLGRLYEPSSTATHTSRYTKKILYTVELAPLCYLCNPPPKSS